MGRTYELEQEVLKTASSVNLGLTGANKNMKTVLESIDGVFGDQVYSAPYISTIESITGSTQAYEAELANMQTQNESWTGVKTFTDGINFGVGQDVLKAYGPYSFTPAVVNISGTSLVVSVESAVYCRIGSMVYFNAAIKMDTGGAPYQEYAYIYMPTLPTPLYTTPCFVWGSKNSDANLYTPGGMYWSGRVSMVTLPPSIPPNGLTPAVSVYYQNYESPYQWRQLQGELLKSWDDIYHTRLVVVCGCYFSSQL